MKKIKVLFSLFLIGLLLCGCQETPEKVKENMQEYGDNPQVESSEITYCSAAELKESKMPEITGSNLSFPKEVDFSHIEDVEVLSLSVEKNFLEDNNVEKYAKLFGVDKRKLKKEGAETPWGQMLSYDNERTGNYLNISKNGGMARMAGELYDVKPNVVEKKYNLDKDDISKVKVTLTDGTVNLSKLCKDTEQWLEDNMQIDGIRYKISDVYVRKSEEKQEAPRTLSMLAEYDHKGIRFNYHMKSESVEDENFETKDITTFLAAELGMADSGIPSYFSRNINVAIDSAEQVEQVVDLESAVNIVKEKMSAFGVFKISEILPLYMLNLGKNAEKPGAQIEARPGYAFLITEEHKDDKYFGILKMNNCKHYFFVDMVTGELITDLENK